MRKLLLLLLVFVLAFYACRQEKQQVPLVNEPDFQKGESFLYKQNDSAYYYFNKVTIASKDSLQIAMSYNNMAVIQADAGDYFGSQESLAASLKFLNPQKEKDHKCLAADYNELGLSSINLKNNDAAIAFFDQALRYTSDKKFQQSILNNKALAYQQKGAYPQALKIYREVILQATRKKTYARILTNMATTQWLYKRGYHAANELLKALYIRKKEDDQWGINSSYAHLADFYANSRPDSALFYADQMYAVALKIKSPDDQLEALQKLIKLDVPQAAKAYFLRYQKLNDSLQTTRNAAKNQFALIRYDAERNKADNLKLQKDNTEKKYQLFKQSILLYSTLLLFIAGAFMAVWLYRKRKQRLELEAQNTIRENQLRISKKVHDVVANGLYRMMTEIDNQDDLDKLLILDKIEAMYEQSRDISYEQALPSNQSTHQRISGLLTSFATGSTKVFVAGNSLVLWEKVSANAVFEIENVLQELMVNMKKHSHASNVAVKFKQKGSMINIYYTDDGVGFLKQMKYKNGLTSTGNRMQAIGGAITFGNNTDKGAKIIISFPVA